MNKQEKELNVKIGAKVRERRKAMGMSQEVLAGLLGVTYQQLQKYEWGSNRISAARLYRLSQLLEASTSYFYGQDTFITKLPPEEELLLRVFRELGKENKAYLKQTLQMLERGK